MLLWGHVVTGCYHLLDFLPLFDWKANPCQINSDQSLTQAVNPVQVHGRGDAYSEPGHSAALGSIEAKAGRAGDGADALGPYQPPWRAAVAPARLYGPFEGGFPPPWVALFFNLPRLPPGLSSG